MNAGSGLKARILTPRLPWQVVFVAVLAVMLLMPLLLESFRLWQFSKYLCFAIIGLGIGLAWGYGGMLTLGQGLFFGLGAYSMGMYLKLEAAGPGGLPDFMSWSGVEKLPAFWEPFHSLWVAIAGVFILPTVVATVLGFLIFRQRVRGAYFAILTQALAGAFAILLVGQQGYTGGTNGLTNLPAFFGISKYSPEGRRTLYFIAAAVLLVLFLLLRLLVRSRFGRLLLAVRDGEDRVRFLGYDPTVVKTITFAISAVTASIAGALFVPIAGIVNPGMLDIVPSIGFVLAVAVGGRFSLIGAIVGAIVVNWASTTFSEDFPSTWTYLQGALFIGVIAFAPKGLAGLFRTAGAFAGRQAAKYRVLLPFQRVPAPTRGIPRPPSAADTSSVAVAPPDHPAASAADGGAGSDTMEPV